MSWAQAIGVVAFALNVWGNLELTRASNRGHMIRLASNACWLVYSPLVGAWALLLNHATFAGINVLGWHRWRRLRVEEKTRSTGCPHCTHCGVGTSGAAGVIVATEYP